MALAVVLMRSVFSPPCPVTTYACVRSIVVIGVMVLLYFLFKWFACKVLALNVLWCDL